MAQRVTMSEEDIANKTGGALRNGILVGVHREADLSSDLTDKYTGVARQIHFEKDEDRIKFGGVDEERD